MTRHNRFAGWWDKPRPAVSRVQVARVMDGKQILGTVDRIGAKFESFGARQQFIGRHKSRDEAVAAIYASHKAAHIVNGLFR